jgi:hypothetical protein
MSRDTLRRERVMRKAIVLTVVVDDSTVDNEGMPEPTADEIADNIVDDLDGQECWIDTDQGQYLAILDVRTVTVDGVTIYDYDSALITLTAPPINNYLPRHSRSDAADVVGAGFEAV